MTPKRRDNLVQQCHDEAIRMITAEENGKMVPRLGTIAHIYKILEEITKACPTEPG